MSTDPRITKLAEDIIRQLARKGQIIEGGWRAYEIVHDLQNAPPDERAKLRRVFFFGAQHLFASVLSFLEGGLEETETDMDSMRKLDAELEAFIAEVAGPTN